MKKTHWLNFSFLYLEVCFAPVGSESKTRENIIRLLFYNNVIFSKSLTNQIDNVSLFTSFSSLNYWWYMLILQKQNQKKIIIIISFMHVLCMWFTWSSRAVRMYVLFSHIWFLLSVQCFTVRLCSDARTNIFLYWLSDVLLSSCYLILFFPSVTSDFSNNLRFMFEMFCWISSTKLHVPALPHLYC